CKLGCGKIDKGEFTVCRTQCKPITNSTYVPTRICKNGKPDADLCYKSCHQQVLLETIPDEERRVLFVVHHTWREKRSERYQAVSFGECAINETCEGGACQQMYQTYNVLVSTTKIADPKGLTNAVTSWRPVEIPSYCSCVHVGSASISGLTNAVVAIGIAILLLVHVDW
ncbi:hypothetical protein CAPTEDRAFT_187153, partial [Capitella teleta]